jgi:cation diffusion facilitator CzcD-associated flavoprotein CzcO
VTDLLVVGAGPYALSTAAAAQDRGLSATVVGRPMGFWREHMPAGMYLRSGPDWHLDPAGELTLERYLAERGIPPTEVDPLPLDLFLEYAEWFRAGKGIAVRDDWVTSLRPGWEATLESGETVRARTVVAAPGVAHFAQRPGWAEQVPGEHTVDLVHLSALSGARVLIIGGRQSAYEWAALLGEHGAERIDVVHRHAVPRFDRVSWRFVDPHVESTLATPGWWRSLTAAERDAIGRRFWEVGRLTLEHWLLPRLERAPLRARADTQVIHAQPAGDGVDVALSDGTQLHADRVVYACGYKADVARVPYLRGLGIATSDGFPDLDHAFQTSLPGLYMPGFAATRDFGPFFGFVKAAPAAGELIARDLIA